MQLFAARKVSVPLVFAVTILLLLGLFGLGHYEMSGMDGEGTHCPLMGMSVLCTMTPTAHLSAWQQMFATTLQHMTISLLLLILAFAITLYFFGRQFKPRREKFVTRHVHREEIFDALHLALARGIIHPKVF